MELLVGFAVLHGPSDGALRVLYAVLCDPELHDGLIDEGFDVDALDAAVAPPVPAPPVAPPERAPARSSVWEPPRAGSSPAGGGLAIAPSFFRSLPFAPDRRYAMGDVLVAARAMPELRRVWAAASRSVSREPRPSGAVIVDNDDETPFETVIGLLEAHAGCTRLDAMRSTLRIDQRGSARVPVDDPAGVARAMTEAARAAGFPLRVTAEVG